MRGPWVCDSYFKQETVGTHDADGWFDTGDVATVDPDGYIELVDRTKDVIKSGGEWISSIHSRMSPWPTRLCAKRRHRAQG